MKVIIELYDREEPLNNVLSVTTLRPDVLVVMGDRQIQKKKNQKPLLNYLASEGLSTEVRFVVCRNYDIEHIAGCMDDLIHEYGAENCILDVMGGSDTLLMATGLCCKDHVNVSVITLRERTDELLWLWGPEKGTAVPVRFSAGIKEIISLSGGELLRNGHVNRKDITPETVDIIHRVFGVYMRFRKRWPQFVQYLQQLNHPEYAVAGETACYCGPRQFSMGKWTAAVDLEIMMELAEVDVVQDFHMNGSRCTIRYASEQVAAYLTDVGAWLELYTYTMLKKAGFFHDIDISVVVSWDDDENTLDTVNEIDLIALDGVGQLFISCKTGTPDNSVLNEIQTLTERFGTQYAVPVLVTAGQLEHESASVYRRALEMGVVVLDADDLNETAFQQRLLALRKRWNTLVE